jgi:hypothetical protein
VFDQCNGNIPASDERSICASNEVESTKSDSVQTDNASSGSITQFPHTYAVPCHPLERSAMGAIEGKGYHDVV